MKYMIMTFGGQSGLEGKSPEWIKGMIEFMQRIDVELTETGELMFQQGLADAPQAKTVTVRDDAPVATEGPVGGPSESLAGFWIVDVESEARAIEIAARISKAADAAMEIRQCLDAPPLNWDGGVWGAVGRLVAFLAAATVGAGAVGGAVWAAPRALVAGA
jgi:hypothetical protein